MKDQIPRTIMKDRIVHISPMEEVRILSRNTSNREQLLELSKKYCNDYDTCRYLLHNSYLTENCKEVLARSKNVEVRRMLAAGGEKILSTQTQLRLVLDSDKIVKENLARTTTKEKIKEILFKSNPEDKSNEKIRAYCLKRMRNMKMMERFILTSSSEILDKYADNILSNRHLDCRVLHLFVTVKIDLTDNQKRLVKDHPSYDPVDINLP